MTESQSHPCCKDCIALFSRSFLRLHERLHTSSPPHIHSPNKSACTYNIRPEKTASAVHDQATKSFDTAELKGKAGFAEYAKQSSAIYTCFLVVVTWVLLNTIYDNFPVKMDTCSTVYASSITHLAEYITLIHPVSH